MLWVLKFSGGLGGCLALRGFRDFVVFTFVRGLHWLFFWRIYVG